MVILSEMNLDSMVLAAEEAFEEAAEETAEDNAREIPEDVSDEDSTLTEDGEQITEQEEVPEDENSQL